MPDPKPARPRWEGAVVDPFVAPGTPTPDAEVRPEHADAEAGRLLDHFLARLHALGASREEALAVAQGWFDLGDDWTEDRRREVALTWSDDQIRADMLRGRDETDGLGDHIDGGTGEENVGTEVPADGTEVDLSSEGSDVADTIEEMARELIDAGETADGVMEWVNGDPGTAREKAVAALAVERSRGADARKTLVGRLERTVDRE